MAYEKQEWKNDSAPYIDAAHLNHMEDGIVGALPKSGGTMTGSLILKGSPTEDLEAVTKKYVDTNAMYIETTISRTDTSTKYIGKLPCNDFSFDKYLVLVYKEGSYDSYSLLPLTSSDDEIGTYSDFNGSYDYISIKNDGKVYISGRTAHTYSKSFIIRFLILPTVKENLIAN